MIFHYPSRAAVRCGLGSRLSAMNPRSVRTNPYRGRGLSQSKVSGARPHFSRRGERKCVRGASIRGGRWVVARGGVLESPLSTMSERNEIEAHLSHAFAVRW